MDHCGDPLKMIGHRPSLGRRGAFMTDTIDRNRLLFPSLASFYAGVEPYLYPFMRAVVGLMMLPHGIEKLERGVSVWAANNPAKLGFWPPTAWGWVVVLIETVGAVCIALGLFTR